jgi:hypothetical protein
MERVVGCQGSGTGRSQDSFGLVFKFGRCGISGGDLLVKDGSCKKCGFHGVKLSG